MPAHTKDREGNLSVGTQIQSLRISGPLSGVPARLLLATLCVTLNLALFAHGGADPTGEFCLRTLSYCRPTTIVGLFWIRLSYPTM
jgi:hypothetical protein